MAIAVDETSFGSSGTTSTTVSHTVSGSERILIVGLGDQDSSEANVTGVTYNGVAMTKIDAAMTGSDPTWTHLYGLLAPATGTHDIVASRTAASDMMFLVAASYTGVSQATAIGSLTKTEGGGNAATSFSGTLSTSADNSWTVLACYNRGQGESAGAGTFQRVNGGNVTNMFDSNGPITPAGSTSLNVNQNSNNYGYVMVAFGPGSITIVRSLSESMGRAQSRNVSSFARAKVAARTIAESMGRAASRAITFAFSATGFWRLVTTSAASWTKRTESTSPWTDD